MREVAQLFPDPEVLLRLEPEELGAKLLFLLRKRNFPQKMFMPTLPSSRLGHWIHVPGQRVLALLTKSMPRSKPVISAAVQGVLKAKPN